MQIVCRQLLVFLSFLLTICCQDCNPLYLRLFYDPNSDPALKVDMIVMFNTLDKCPDNYIAATYLNSHAEFACTVNMIQIVEQNNTYLQQWVHTCNLQLDSPSQIDSFNYRVQGGQVDTNFSLVQLTSDSLPFIAVVTANLNLLEDKQHLPFAQAFQELLLRRTTQIANNEGINHYRVNAIIINGGFAENLTGLRGNNFNKIMTLLGQFSNRWPLLLNIGPNEINNQKDFSLIQDCFVLGGIQGDSSNGMQSYSFSRKVSIILLQTSAQHYVTNNTQLPHFQQTLSSLSTFLKDSQEQGNDFTIAFNHYGLTCNNADKYISNHICEDGSAPLFDMLTGSNGQNNTPIDLYVGSYQNNYQRNYPIKNGSYDRKEDFIFDRGEFIALNQGAGKSELHSQHNIMKNSNKVMYRLGKPGFGIISIHGNGDLPKQNASSIQMKQNLVRKIEKDQSTSSAPIKLEHKNTNYQVLDETYLRNQDLNELDLFLLNYKHITINGTQLLVKDVFRIITQPVANPPILRHHLTVA